MKISQKPNLSFTAHAKELQSAISKVQSITQFVDCLDTERKHALIVAEGKAFVAGITPDAFACIQIADSTAHDQGSLVFDPGTVNGLLKGRDVLNITGDKSQITFSAVKGKYTARTELATFDDADMVRVKSVFEAPKAKKLKNAVITAIRAGIKAAELTNFYSDEVILAFVKVGEKGVTIECADNFHISCYQDKTPSEAKFRFAIPVKTFGLIDKFIGDEDAQFSLDGSQLRVQGKGFTVSLPETQADESYFDLVPQYLKALTNPKTKLKFKTEALKTVDNMFAIITEDTKMAFAVGKKSVEIQMTTRTGAVSDEFKATVEGEARTAHIDPRILSDLFKKVKGDEIPMEFFVGKKGTSSCFKIVSKQSDTSRLTQIGTFYDE